MVWVTAVLCLLVAAAACVAAEDEWSWGKDGEESPVSQGQATFSVSVIPEKEDEQETPLAARAIGVDVLPLEPHGELTEEELVALAEEVGDREARFLGISEKLCSYGIGINVSHYCRRSFVFVLVPASNILISHLTAVGAASGQRVPVALTKSCSHCSATRSTRRPPSPIMALPRSQWWCPLAPTVPLYPSPQVPTVPLCPLLTPTGNMAQTSHLRLRPSPPSRA